MHRDLKPPNIVLSIPGLEDSEVPSKAEIADLGNVEYKLCDWNLACFSPGGLER